jgi:hypothetical protein
MVAGATAPTGYYVKVTAGGLRPHPGGTRRHPPTKRYSLIHQRNLPCHQPLSFNAASAEADARPQATRRDFNPYPTPTRTATDISRKDAKTQGQI